MPCDPVHANLGDERFGRTVCADVVALDQMLVYNRFGSFNPFGMMFALRRDVVSVDRVPEATTAAACDQMLGTESYPDPLSAGEVRLKDCKRPRPLVLRANAGDILHVRLTNYLRADPPGLSETFCKAPKAPDVSAGDKHFGDLFRMIRRWVSEGTPDVVEHDEALCLPPSGSPGSEADGNWPATRGLNFAIQGLTTFGLDSAGNRVEAPRACKGLATIASGASVDCYYEVEREGPFFIASTAAPSGGEGDGGSITHGLFGALMAEKTGSRWYRSQVSHAAFAEVWNPAPTGPRHAVDSIRDLSAYDHLVGGEPVLHMLKDRGGDVFELVHSDLNAIVHQPDNPETAENDSRSFREFSVFFHDELKTFYTRNFEELGDFGAGQLAGIRDGFAINYGSSGLGDMVIANRKGIGPAANCQECLYEEFFLTSWAQGDPALLEQFSDDPSNVHHSYLNDPVVYRNFHAGPKETHVFHLHAHQWFAGNDRGRGSYLDSQTVGPQQGFTYNVYDGGLEVYHQGPPGGESWYETLGSGNRNRTPGDAIFHCHLYPHFAQGMWELWRVHDVLEDGTRKLPDGQWQAELSLAEMDAATRAKKRPGSVHQATGRWVEPAADVDPSKSGTPVPAIVPLPNHPWPLLPTYPAAPVELQADGSVTEPDGTDVPPSTEIATLAGYPFYIAGKPGHRPPQAPMDIARALDTTTGDVTDDYLDGGLPRHVFTDEAEREFPFEIPPLPTLNGVEQLADAESNMTSHDREAKQSQILALALALGDMTMELKEARLDLLEYDGEPIEKAAMAFHHRGELASGSMLDLRHAEGGVSVFSEAEAAYPSRGGAREIFAVNGAPAKPGSPFADPCGAPNTLGAVRRIALDNYLIDTGAGVFQVFQAPPGTAPGATTPQTPATDADVSNWVQWRRDDPGLADQPVLFYDDGSGPEVIAAPAVIEEEDPFLAGTGDRLMTDPAVVGYRRFAASAVQVDLVTNRAGWHDPQARINVLTEKSDGYKEGQGRISPKITASEEPFFFRALSGECIEFRHTNELPKDLELDDFQVRSPTDTIGQHIHLVKFDVTASDGSANGWNYEDGTLAPDEIATRICAAKNTGSALDITTMRTPGTLMMREHPELCVDDGTGHWVVSPTFYHQIWQLKLSVYRDLFQTTTQRWFADPILSATRAPDDSGGIGDADRTLRTVFSHDHFGPSSIQQHGFYTALVIEPQTAQICATDSTDCTDLRVDRSLVVADEQHVGARKVIVDQLPLDPDSPSYREFALSIADFATLYDPRNKIENAAEIDTAFPDKAVDDGGAKSDLARGMAMLVCEAGYAAENQPRNMAEICGSALARDGDGYWFGQEGQVPPAWLAAKMSGDDPNHSALLASNLLATAKGRDEIEDLKEHMLGYRRMAAGYERDDTDAPLARPVAPPERPESISVDHHDPYLVNYRGEPLPLRVGTSSGAGSDCELKDLSHWVASLESGVTETCEISRQKTGMASGAGGAEAVTGDLANVFISPLHGDPVTPILDAFDGDPVQIRLIQGAQEVQHTFNLDGYNWPRNVDQSFPAETPLRADVTPQTTLSKACENHPLLAGPLNLASAGRPDQYRLWLADGPTAFIDPDDADFWQAFETMLAMCFNAEGRLAAQEIGISEHFEFRAAYRHDSNLESPGGPVALGDPAGTSWADLYIEFLRVLHRIVPSDTLMHFGSTDALWNGAWGLLRVHRKSILNLRADYLQRVQTAIEELERQMEAPRGPVPRQLRQNFEQLLREPYQAPVMPLPATPPRLLMPDLRVDRSAIDPRTLAPRDEQAIPAPERVIEQGVIQELAPPAGAVPPSIELPLPLDIYRQRAEDAIERLPRQREELLNKRFGEGRSGDAGTRSQALRFPYLPGYELVANCRINAPFVYTAVVAIEAETVFGSMTESGEPGTSYADNLYDQDGLFFALVDPRYLVDPDDPDAVTPAMLDDQSSWTDIPLTRVIDAVKQAYDRPEPLVITVNAGDCVKVTWLNALRSEVDDRGRVGLRDAPGDALMPRITSLNVDWDYEVIAGDENQPIYKSGVTDQHETKPSARLAISLPLPILNKGFTFARPIGLNPIWSMAGISPGDPATTTLSIEDPNGRIYKQRTAQIEQFEFYAGRAAATNSGLFCQIGSSAPLSLLASLDRLKAQLPVELETMPLGTGASVTVGDIFERLQPLADRYRTALRRLSDEIGLDIGPPMPWRQLDQAPRMFLQPEQRSGLPSATFSFRGESFTHGVQLEGARHDADALIDLESALALGQQQGRISAQQAATALRRIDELQQQLTEQLGDALPPTSDLAPLLSWLCTIDVHYLPYAFGALPVKSHGDVIGHAVQGLIGAIAVVPQDATIENVRAPKEDFGAARGREQLCLTPADISMQRNREEGREISEMMVEIPRACTNSVIVPEAPAHPQDWHWTATLTTKDQDDVDHTIRQFTLFWQDGLNLRDLDTTDVSVVHGTDQKLVNDCGICDDSYDLGERGVSYRSAPFHVRLRGENGNSAAIESHYNLSVHEFGEEFFPLKPSEIGPAALPPMPVLRGKAGEEVVVHVIHPGGRARQRAFVTIAQDYDDLFPGFGFPRAALLAPGKGITASLTKPLEAGCYFWFDGPAQTRGGGSWGLLDVVASADFDDLAISSCERHP